MPLPNLVQYSGHRLIVISWKDEDDNIIDLTGATLYGRMEHDKTKERKNITGTLAVLSATAGTFTWAPTAADVSTDGGFHVEFRAKYSGGGLPERTYRTALRITPAMDSPSASPSLSPSASVSPSPSRSPSASKSPSASASP